MPKKRFAQREERDEIGWMSGLFTRKRRSPQPQVTTTSELNTCTDSRLMRRNKAKNLHLFLSEIMKKLRHSFKREKPQHENRSLLLGKKRRFQRSLSRKDHFFVERMTSISLERPQSHQGHFESAEKRLSEMLSNEDHLDQHLSTRKGAQRMIWDQDSSTLLSRSTSHDLKMSETVADDSSSDQIVDEEVSQVEAYVEEREGEILPHLSLLPVASQSQYGSKTEEYKLVVEPLFIEYEINPATGEAKRQPLCNQLQERNHSMDDKEAVFKYVRAVMDAIDSSWEELYLKTEFCDQLLNPALISNKPFYPNQLGIDHELLFDCINEVLFEFCRFPQWVASFGKPRKKVLLSSGVERVVLCEVQKEVYGHLFPLQRARSLDQIVEEDMAKPRSWLDIGCGLECIGFEVSDMILDELLEEVMLELDLNVI